MKASLIFALAVCLFNSTSPKAQCNVENLDGQCIPQVSSGFNYIKSYKIDGRGGAKDKVEYSYFFCRDTQYLINICSRDSGPNSIIVNLFDAQRNKVASSKVGNQCVSRLAYQCNSTGIFYIQYTFDSPSAYCGSSALAFKRSISSQ